ncbi:MAG: type II CAAX endopeptidase family protein [Planctomycetota bacterium]|nr:type II CAAX endopeptidase family protein [Planctomycetota bacterium]
MSGRPVGTLRVVAHLARVSTRRWINRYLARFRKKAKGRTGTARSSGRSIPILIIFGALMLFQSMNLSSMLVSRLSNGITEYHGGEDDVRPHFGLGPSTDAWPAAEHAPALEAAMGLVLTVFAGALVFMGLGSGNQELAQPGWTLEWLFTFPVSTRGLFLAKIGEYTFTNVLGWFVLLPLLFVLYWDSGWGWWAVPLGLAGAAYVNGIVASIRVLAETWLRKRLSLHRVKNVQALCTIVGMVLFFAVLGFAFSHDLPAGYFRVLDAAPAAFLWLPTSVPVLLCHTGAGAVAMLLFAALFLYGTIAMTARLVSDGLVTASGPYQGVRGRAAAASKKSAFKGILGKELLLLLRDRNFLVQTLVIPAFIIGFQAYINPRLFRGSGAVVAFGIGAYVSMFGSFSVLVSERQCLWLLFTFPQPLWRLLRRKVLLWACSAELYALAVLALAWRPETLDAATMLTPLLALFGVFLYAFIAAGMGVLGTDPFEQEGIRRVAPEWTFLFMAVASVFGHALVIDSIWQKLVLVTLTVLLAYAIWEKVRERLPLLLDPTQRPPRDLSLSDGLIATLIFFEIQLIAALAGAPLVVAYLLAGVLTVLLALFVLWRLKVPSLASKLGLRSGPRLGRALALGVAFGGVAALFGMAYLYAVDLIEPLREMKEEALRLSEAAGGISWSVVALAIFGAPLFEEFLFRGMVFRGLRRTINPTLSVLGSALVFAIVHPPLSFVPVFVLGVAAAFSFERTRLLWAPIAAHMTYNAVVFLTQA